MTADSREFTGRAVRWAARQGIRQFIDLGVGLVPSPAVHEMARSVCADARTGYVDDDREVTDYLADVLLDGRQNEGTAVVAADLSDSAAVLAELERGKIIEPSEPMCLIATMVLHFWEPDDA